MALHRLKNLQGHLLENETIRSSSCSAQMQRQTEQRENLIALQNQSTLTPEQIVQYERDGFIVIRELLSATELNKFRQRFLDYCNGSLKNPTMTIMRDVNLKSTEKKGERAITKIQDFQDDKVLFEYCQHPDILKYVKVIIGNDAKAVHTMLINKPPDLGKKSSRHPLHQDLYYFPFRPVDRIVCSWTAMQTINRENGCLVVIPGSHRGDLLAHGYPNWEGGVNKMYHGILDLPKGDKLCYLDMKEGDTVFFHPLLIHGSGANNSDQYRKAISCHYANANCQYINVQGTLQESIAEEIEEVMKKRVGKKVNIHEVWRLKSRLVSGNEAKL